MVKLLHQIIDDSADHKPDGHAFRCAGGHITYGELALRTNRLARILAEHGVQPGDRVGVFLRKSLETAVAVFGIMKAGAAYVPLDPNLPTARLESILIDCDIRHLVTHDALTAQLEGLADRLATESALQFVIGPNLPGVARWTVLPWNDVFSAPGAPLDPARISPGDPAYLMYTSGSTGMPKGIIHTHSSGLAYARCAAETYGLSRDDRLSGFPPLHFDQSTFDYFSGPLVGATTVIIPESYMLMPASLSKHMEDERLTIWYSVPYALTQLLLRGVLHDRDLRSLRWVLFGGETFPMKHLRSLMQLWPHARFSNVYGPAEVNQCTFYHLPEPPPAEAEAIPIGPTWHIAAGLVLDRDDQIIPAGQIGELVVRTPTMMQGYWNRTDLNADAFYYPEGDADPKPYYRTGDLVRRSEDGLYWFVGREDRQVKTRGYRVELDEVEAVLSSHPAVAEVAVYTVSDTEGRPQICARVLPHSDAEVGARDVLAFAARHLPAYAVPARVEFADGFPRTSSGKIDRHLLGSMTVES
ncbi:MAG: amino acid adenylation domain-containing protein [Rhodothermales bacterium]|nr:amino acid adenylation domain-containing protein [Rhodothermales bacterium]